MTTHCAALVRREFNHPALNKGKTVQLISRQIIKLNVRNIDVVLLRILLFSAKVAYLSRRKMTEIVYLILKDSLSMSKCSEAISVVMKKYILISGRMSPK